MIYGLFLGIGIMLVLFLCLVLGYYIGRRQKKTDIVEKLSREEQEEAEKRMKGLENILNYDYDVAIGRRVKNG